VEWDAVVCGAPLGRRNHVFRPGRGNYPPKRIEDVVAPALRACANHGTHTGTRAGVPRNERGRASSRTARPQGKRYFIALPGEGRCFLY
jgi:hypothetical protein